jgi:hypothetical protein
MNTKPKAPKAIAVLNLHNRSVLQTISDARHYVAQMTGNVLFPNPTPALVDLSNKINALEAAYNVALTRVKGSTLTMHTELDALRVMMKTLAAYVEGIANSNQATAANTIAAAGMIAKKRSAHVSKGFRVLMGSLSGTVKLSTTAAKRGAYIYQMCTDPANPANWVTIYTGTVLKFVKTGLTVGTRYYFRVAVCTKGVQADWSVTESILVS